MGYILAMKAKKLLVTGYAKSTQSQLAKARKVPAQRQSGPDVPTGSFLSSLGEFFMLVRFKHERRDKWKRREEEVEVGVFRSSSPPPSSPLSPSDSWLERSFSEHPHESTLHGNV